MLRWLAVAGLSLAAACSETAPIPPQEITSLPRPLTSGEQSIIDANNAFTLALFQKASAADPAGNVFLSPLSASMALGMTLNGARTTTFDAMRTALQYGSLSQPDINAGYKSLISLLTGLDPTVESDIANSVWYRQTVPIDPAFVAAAEGYFGARVSPLDFNDEPKSVETVNAWVGDKTNGRISSILDQVDPQDQMYLVNAIYFKASWRTAFDRNDTKDDTFTRGDGAAETVPMMHFDHEGVGTRAWADGTLMAELPYGNTAFNMDVYLPPDTSTVEHLIERMKLDDLAGATSTTQVQLWMPRVKLEYERHLAADLAGLGMGEAFSGAADFSGMTTSHVALTITDVLQKTFLSIDEEGTEAAAVTKVTMGDSAPVVSVIRCDRPYLIVIRERLSGAILFIGKINTV